MTGDREMFEEITPNHGPRRYVTFGDNSKGKVLGLGKVDVGAQMHTITYGTKGPFVVRQG